MEPVNEASHLPAQWSYDTAKAEPHPSLSSRPLNDINLFLITVDVREWSGLVPTLYTVNYGQKWVNMTFSPQLVLEATFTYSSLIL